MMQNKNLSVEESLTLAIQNHQKNNFEVARDLYEKILKISPDHFKVIFLLGTLSAQTKNFDRAKQLLQKVIQIQPNNVDAHNNLGSVHKETGENQKAIHSYEKVIQINPNYSSAYNNLGAVYKEISKQQKAISCFEKAIQINPNYVEAHNNLGIIFKELEENQKAITCFEKAIQINPNYVEAHNNLGVVLKAAGEYQKAISCFEKAIEHQPNFRLAHQNLMDIYEATNQEKELRTAILKAQTLLQGNPITKLFEGILLNRNDKFVEAKKCLETISFKASEINKEILRVSTLAKCYDRIGDSDKAFNYFTKTNNLVLQQTDVKVFNKNRYLHKIKIRREFFTKSKVNKWSNLKLSDKRRDPTFLVGFPRSGTTLLDTILDSHPMIEVLEEKNMVEKFINSLSELPSGGLDDLENMQDDQLKQIRDTYFNSLGKMVKNKDNSKLYIDKLPLNIIYVGEIFRIFPNAKFILSLRHPCDCALSCFMQNFKLNDAMVNFLNLDDTAYLYDSVMNLWVQYTSIFSINYYEIKYENIVENLESTVRSILNFLELPWNHSVLEYLKTAKKRDRIATPSYTQVIKPIYSHANGRWKRYIKKTSNIYSTLEPWIKKFNY